MAVSESYPSPPSSFDGVLSRWSDTAAVARTTGLCALAGANGVVDLGSLRELTEAARGLEDALAAETAAEGADQVAEDHALQAQQVLLEAFRPRLEDAAFAAIRRQLQPVLDQWTDPYASDATGVALLGRMRRGLHDVPESVRSSAERLLAAIDGMEQAGRARDTARLAFVAAVDRRVRARRSWNARALGIVRRIPPADFEAWLVELPVREPSPFPEAAWFEEEE